MSDLTPLTKNESKAYRQMILRSIWRGFRHPFTPIPSASQLLEEFYERLDKIEKAEGK